MADRKQSWCIRYFPLLLSTLAAVLGIAAVCVANSGHRHPVKQVTKSELYVCVPCDKLTCAHELDLLQSLTHIGDQCCALNATQLAVLTQLIVGSRPPLTRTF
ncbi:uncharacterized protein LOC131931017 [Physella acuta]|uniref:uncharacterized protein LOC131931017 n=1 Tax=Physella acuta TaxID=109671 RepID=UPI0027DB2824|nr:uncharacterized protein LOC131931017 [Physella acuta]